jgi:molecular chaperone DnaJ
LDLNIPAGISSGTKLRVDGGGNAGQRGGPSGDLYVVIHVRDHAVFERDDDDLYSEETISFVDALLGAQLDVKTIEGTATLRIPEGTQPGTRFRLKSKGIKHLKGFGRGDQYVKISVDIPKKLSKKQREIIESFQEAG